MRSCLVPMQNRGRRSGSMSDFTHQTPSAPRKKPWTRLIKKFHRQSGQTDGWYRADRSRLSCATNTSISPALQRRENASRRVNGEKPHFVGIAEHRRRDPDQRPAIIRRPARRPHALTIRRREPREGRYSTPHTSQAPGPSHHPSSVGRLRLLGCIENARHGRAGPARSSFFFMFSFLSSEF